MKLEEHIDNWARQIRDEYQKEHRGMICEMAAICDDANMMVWVWPDEGKNIPHFHVGDLNYGSEWRSSICILKDEYFLHDNDIPLNARQKRRMMRMLRAKPKKKDDQDDPFATNWEKLLYQWNQVP